MWCQKTSAWRQTLDAVAAIRIVSFPTRRAYNSPKALLTMADMENQIAILLLFYLSWVLLIQAKRILCVSADRAVRAALLLPVRIAVRPATQIRVGLL